MKSGDDQHRGPAEGQRSAVEPGSVYLVGAGPGDPGLLTRAGAEALAAADVVVYDRLIDDSLLALAKAGAELVYVGKAASLHAVPQDEINRILVARARRGLTVCRLKGGDPFVLGRGGEEASYLRDHRIPFVVIPGVTSAVAVPAYAGILVTDRRFASSFTVVSGHEVPDAPDSRVDWESVAQGPETIVILMGLTRLAAIARRLIDLGRPPGTPAAAIQSGTTPGQRVVVATLVELADRVAEEHLRPPVVVVVGEVVRLHKALDWFSARA